MSYKALMLRNAILVKASGGGLDAGISKLGVTKSIKTTNKIKPHFYVKSNGDVIPSTGYRATAGKGEEAARKGNLMSSSGDTYFTFDNIENMSSKTISDKMQIPYEPTVYGKFDTLQIIDDIRVPMEDWGKGTKPEPITQYFGKNNPNGDNFGNGGATQAVTKLPIKDFELKEIKK